MRCAGPPYIRWLLVVSAFLGLVGGSFVNRTIDDGVHGDSVTGAQVQYLPLVPASQGSLWFNQTSCAGCADVPDAKLAHENTWTAALYLADIGSMSVTMKFSGTAIYVFFIVPNFAADSGLASVVRCQFFIDGAPVGSFTHDSDGSSGFLYNTLVYENITVPAGDHVLLIETTGADPAIIIFDYVLYTVEVPDPPTNTNTNMNTNSLPPPSPSSTTANAPPQTSIAQVDGTDSTTTESITLTTQTNSLPAFPTAPDASQSATFISSSLPFLITPVPPDATPPPFATIPAVSPDTVTDAGAIQRSSHVVAIVAGVAGGVIFVIFALLAFIIYRRRRRRFQASQGTVSVFDLLNDSPPPQPPARRRPLPAPPMFDHPAGRSIDATPNKTDAPFMDRARFHSAQSSVSSYADSRSDLRIHIPMASFQQSDRSHSPMSHAHSNSHSHAHSPITRNGVPMPPEQEEIVRELLMGARAGEGASLRRGSVRSDYTPSTTTGRDDEELWGPPVIHVDSGIRISRAMMELPPMYAAS